MVNKSNFWKDKKVFVTGHTGFKGSWLSLWLKNLGADVTGFSLAPPTEINLFDLTSLKSEINSITGNILNFEKLRNAIKESKPEIVIHMAAQSLVRESYKDPILTYETNVMGTVNILETIRQIGGVKVVVNVTSDKCYENKEWLWGYRETDSMGGYDPYSSSKGCAELVTSAYRRSFFNSKDFDKHGLALSSARAGNVIGGGDFSQDRLIPDIVRAAINKEKLTIRYPHSIRPWQHVLEPLNGYLTLCEKLYKQPKDYCGSWNFGPSDFDIKPVSWILDKFTEYWEEKILFDIEKGEKPHEASLLKLDSSKSNMLLDFSPKLNIEKALSITVDWYKAYKNKEDMKNFTIEQIKYYEGLSHSFESGNPIK